MERRWDSTRVSHLAYRLFINDCVEEFCASTFYFVTFYWRTTMKIALKNRNSFTEISFFFLSHKRVFFTEKRSGELLKAKKKKKRPIRRLQLTYFHVHTHVIQYFNLIIFDRIRAFIITRRTGGNTAIL